MLKIFRKIRHQMLSSGKFKKYIVYAIGEIVLVVIGILIALSINNWNENQKDRVQETKVLQQIKNDVEKNQEDIESLIDVLEFNEITLDTLLKKLEKKQYSIKFAAQIALIHRKSYFNNSNLGYRLLENGLGAAITNDTLLKEILELYEIDLDNLLTKQKLMHHHIDNRMFPLTNKLFKILTNYRMTLDNTDENKLDFYKPLDFEALSENNEYINVLLQLKTMYQIRLAHCEEVSKKIDGLLMQLKKGK